MSLLLLSSDALLNGNVPGSVIDELAELLFRLDDGLIPGDLRGMSGHLRGNFNTVRQFFGSIRLLSS